MDKLILMTVGNSIFDDDKFEHSDIRRLEQGIEATDRSDDNIENQIADIMSKVGLNELLNLSAEMSSLIAFNNKHPIKDGDVIILLHSEDFLNEVCASINAKAIAKRYFPSVPIAILKDDYITGLTVLLETTCKGSVGMIRIKGLEEGTGHEQFADAMQNLADIINEVRKNYLDHKGYIDVTGGFKGVIPFATALALRCEMDMFYLHERNTEVIVLLSSILKKLIQDAGLHEVRGVFASKSLER